MRIFIVCSRHFCNRISEIEEELKGLSHEIVMPNSYEDPFKDDRTKENLEEYIKFKQEMFLLQENKIKTIDSLLVLNFDKNNPKNYVGGATFLEIYDAWKLGKRIYLYNQIPDNIFKDELIGMNPIILNGNLTKIK